MRRRDHALETGYMEKALAKIKTLFKTGFFHIFGSSVINKVIAFLSSVVLVRILTKVEYGAFTYAWNIYGMVFILNGMGIESGMLQLASEHSGDIGYTDKVSSFGTKFGLQFNCILAVILLAAGLFAPLKIEAGRPLLCALCVLPIFQLLYNLTTVYLRVQKRNREYAKLQVANTALVFVVSAGCAFLLREMGLVVGHYIACIAAYLIGHLAFRVRLFDRNAEGIGDEKRPLLRISFISMLNNGLSQLMYLLDLFVLGIVDPQETILASYTVATMIPTALTFIPLPLIIYLYPYFAEHRDDGKWCLDRYRKILLGLGGFNLLLSAMLFAAAPLIVRIVFGEQYMDAVPVFRLLAINYFFSGTFRTLSGNLLVTQRKLRFNLFVAVVSSLINVIADYFFIQWWGSMGAALATVLVVLVSGLLSTSFLIYTFVKKAGAAEGEER